MIADVLTSVLAIAALAGGLWAGWRWLDPAVALIGAALIARWAFGMLKTTARALVDFTSDAGLSEHIRSTIESDGDAKLADLHVWQVARTVVVGGAVGGRRPAARPGGLSRSARCGERAVARHRRGTSLPRQRVTHSAGAHNRFPACNDGEPT